MPQYLYSWGFQRLQGQDVWKTLSYFQHEKWVCYIGQEVDH